MVQAWPDWQHPIDLIVPIPLSPERYAARGYNQSERLGAVLAARLGVPLDTTSLQRTRDTMSQVGLSGAERRHNVAGAFAAAGQTLHGRHVLLIDDVYTTGATLDAAAVALLAAGADTVSGYCLARAKQR